METARPATPSDVDDLARLWAEAVAELDGQRGGALLAGSLHRPDIDTFLARSLADADRLLVLGLIDGSPVGVASTVMQRHRREPIAELEVVFVEIRARQVGVAEAMLDVVVDWSARMGATGVDAPALPGNRSAKSFFETNGFQARLLIMHRAVGE